MGYTQQQGQFAEQLACNFLKQQGLSVLNKNYHCRYGEIDLIMKQDSTIVFVEVRYRKANSLVDSVASIDFSKQQKLYRSAENYLQRNNIPDSVPARFDVIAVTQQADSTPEINWIQNAIEG
ncbi:MAG: YraN family protein [Thioalkalispiraceae bacterium]|jgi:putative endonuclease